VTESNERVARKRLTSNKEMTGGHYPSRDVHRGLLVTQLPGSADVGICCLVEGQTSKSQLHRGDLDSHEHVKAILRQPMPDHGPRASKFILCE
jgi:hypothetical protein